MQASYGVGPIPGPTDSEVAKQQLYLDTIRNAFARGSFTPYQQELDKVSEESWSRDTTWLKIKAFCQGQAQEIHTLLACYLFVIAVTPEIAENQKLELFRTALNGLSAENSKNFFHGLRDQSAVLTIHLMRYFSDDHLDLLFKPLFKYTSVCRCEPPIVGWMQAVAKSCWTVEQKQAFLDRLFDRLPKERADEIYYYFTLKTPDAERALVLSSASATLQARFVALDATVREFGQNSLVRLQTKPEGITIQFRDGSHQRRAFLNWFHKEALNHPCADMIASNFGEKDFEWLQARERGLCSHAMRWMTSIATRLQNPSFVREGIHARGAEDFWLFFSYASAFIDTKKRYGEIAENDYRTLANALTPNSLLYLFDALKGAFGDQIIQQLLQTDPDKFVKWSQLILERPDSWQKRGSDELAKLVGLIEKNRGLEEILSRLFLRENEPELLKLTFFAAVSFETKVAIAKILMANKDRGLQTFAGWMRMGQQPNSALRPFVIDALESDLHKVLKAVDANLSVELRQLLEGPQTDVEFLDRLLPVALDLNDPVARSQEAFKKLKRHFQTPNVPFEDRRNFVNSIRKDLRHNLSRSTFVQKLFHELEPQSWPLVFLFFEHDLCKKFYFEYLEEKTGNQTFNNLDKNGPPDMKGGHADNRSVKALEKVAQKVTKEPMQKLQDLLLWQRVAMIEQAGEGLRPETEELMANPTLWIAIATQALHHMVDNPCLAHGQDTSQIAWAMQHFYQAACETNTIYQIMQHYIEIAKPEQFLRTMNRFGQAVFHSNEKGLIKLISESLDAADVNKVNFIVSCLRVGRSSDFERWFWKEPFLKSDEERAAVVKELIRQMGMQFLSLFVSYRHEHAVMIRSLFQADRPYCEGLLHDSIAVLARANNHSDDKLVIFQHFCAGYSDAGVDVMQLVKSYTDLEKAIASWYSEPIGAEINATGYRLMHHFAPHLLYKTALHQMRSHLTNTRYTDLYEFSRILEAFQGLGPLCREQLQTMILQDQELVALVKKAVEERLKEAFEYESFYTCYELFATLVPDWPKRLADWIQTQTKQEKEVGLAHGHTPTYSSIRSLLESLSKRNRLELVLNELPKETCELLKEVIAKIHSNL